MELLQSELTELRTTQAKTVKESEKYKEERDAVYSEYKLIMSERDQVISELDKLQTEVELAESKLKSSTSEKRAASEEMEALRQVGGRPAGPWLWEGGTEEGCGRAGRLGAASESAWRLLGSGPCASWGFGRGPGDRRALSAVPSSRLGEQGPQREVQAVKVKAIVKRNITWMTFLKDDNEEFLISKANILELGNCPGETIPLFPHAGIRELSYWENVDIKLGGKMMKKTLKMSVPLN